MKIAYIYDAIYPYVKGGAEKRFWDLASTMQKRGHQVYLFGMKAWKGERHFVKEGVNFYGLCKFLRMYTKRGRRSFLQVMYYSLSVLPGIISKKFDIVVANAFPYLHLFPVKVYCILRRVPLIITWQEVWDTCWFEYLKFPGGWTARWLERMAMKLADKIIVYSRTVERELILCRLEAKRIVRIPYGVDLQRISNIPPAMVKSDCIFVGRLIREKNVDLFIESISLLVHRRPGLKGVIIGEGPERERLEGMVKHLGLEDNVVFLNFLKDYDSVIGYIKASKVMVFPSQREGFGLAGLEALACGLPLITLSHPKNAAQELVTDKENGFICKKDKDVLCSQIFQIIQDPEVMNRMGEKALSSAQPYDWENIVEAEERAYECLRATRK